MLGFRQYLEEKLPKKGARYKKIAGREHGSGAKDGGRTAKKLGKKASDNPHPHGSVARRMWDDGFNGK